MRSPAFAISLLLALPVLGPVSPVQGFEAVEIQTISVAPGVYMLTGRGGNIGVSVGKDGVFLVDDQFAPLTAKIQAAVAALSDKPVRFVLNTHWHGDHTGGNENLGRAGAVIVAHDNVRTRMSIEQFNKSTRRRTPASGPAALPVVTFNDQITFHLNGLEVHAFHVEPAHTDGDSFIHFRKANVVHAGDLFFSESYPFIDVSTGGSLGGMIKAADRILRETNDRTRIIPGHGSLSDVKGLREYRSMLAAVRERVGKLVQERKSRDDVIAAKPTREFDAQWGGGFLPPDRWVGIVYDGMVRSKGR